MGVHIEAQDEEEMKQLRSRELQLESIEKLNEVIPVVNSLDSVNFEQIEMQTHAIKEIVDQNLEEQPNLEVITNSIDGLANEIKGLKKSLTQTKTALTKIQKSLNELNKKIEG